MAWDKTFPTNSTKIRNYPTVLTDNFAAIEEGKDSLQQWKVNLIERNAIPSAPSVNPTRIDDVVQLYSKNDALGNAEGFVIDAQNPANVIQLTQNGSLGSATGTLKTANITFGSALTAITSSNVVTAWGRFNSSGALVAGVNMGTPAVSGGTGIWTVSTSAVFANAAVGVSLTTFRPGSSSPASINIVTAPSLSANKVSLTVETKDRSGSHINLAFYVLLVGGI